MRELAKSMLRLPWAVSVFGAQEFINVLSPGGARKAQGDFYSTSVAAEGQFSANPIFFAGFQFGDQVQRAAVDLFFDTLELRVFRPEWINRTTSQIVRQTTEVLRALQPGDNLRLYIDLLRNTMGVINLVNRSSSMLALPPGPINLQQAIEKSYTFGQYAPLWLVEGLGEAYADQYWSETVPVQGILTTGQGAELPEKSLLMMHAGIGISFAKHLIRRLTPVSAKPEIAAALHRFINLVRDNSRDGYEGPAFESLGLVTRTWYQAMIPLIDELLWTIDREVLEYFWHGAGRAAFFNYLLPGTTAFQGIRNEAPHGLALLNGTAGAAWAFTLVNIKEPNVVVNLLNTQSELLSSNDAFTNGLISTMLMANDMIPGDPYTTALCAYQPQCGCAKVTDIWNRLVADPCRTATEKYFPVLQKHRRLGEVFRYQDLGQLVQKLGATEQR
jgi:hypothetical protein